MEQNRIPKHIYVYKVQLIFDKGTKTIQWGKKKVISINKTETINKNTNLNYYLKLHHKIWNGGLVAQSVGWLSDS